MFKTDILQIAWEKYKFIKEAQNSEKFKNEC